MPQVPMPFKYGTFWLRQCARGHYLEADTARKGLNWDLSQEILKKYVKNRR